MFESLCLTGLKIGRRKIVSLIQVHNRIHSVTQSAAANTFGWGFRQWHLTRPLQVYIQELTYLAFLACWQHAVAFIINSQTDSEMKFHFVVMIWERQTPRLITYFLTYCSGSQTFPLANHFQMGNVMQVQCKSAWVTEVLSGSTVLSNYCSLGWKLQL